MDGVNLNNGQISCTYKHYLSYKDIVEKRRKYAVIMEDNICFKKDIQDTVQKYLEEIERDHPGWNILHDGDINHSWGPCAYYYDEEDVVPNRMIYRKTNDERYHFNSFMRNYSKTTFAFPTQGIVHGSTRGENYYIINQMTAQLLYDNFLPFGNVVDHWNNYLFRTLGLKVFWAEPPFVHKIGRESTATD